MDKKDSIEFEYFDCQCSSSDHILRFCYDEEDNLLYTEIQLIQYRNIFKRIWIALKYIFKYQCRYGHWDCWMLKEDDCSKLKKLLNRVLKK